MGRTWIARLVEELTWAQDGVLESLTATDPERVRVRPSPTAPSIGFHAWHLARWADRHQVALPGWLELDGPPPAEIWIDRGLSRAWGFDGLDLGQKAIGEGLDDDASAALPLPAPAALGEYARDAFAALVAQVERIPEDAAFDRVVLDLYGDEVPLSEVVLGLLSHTLRHLGMMEAIRGVLGERGTATV